MNSNLSYWYIYYNQLVGGLKGAYGNYETDYYYVSQTEASEWLINYLKEKGDTDNIKVKATYSVNWQFRKFPGIETSYFRYEEKSFSDWDYAIVTNRYISPYQLKNKLWPPENTIHLVYADSIPLCAVLERKSKSDYYGYRALNEGNSTEAIEFLCEAARINCKDEMIFFNLAAALVNNGNKEKADSVLKEGLRLNPGSEPILMYLGNIAKSEKRNNEAMRYYERLISLNRKYFEAYVELAELTAGSDMLKARDLLRQCLILNPAYKPAIITLAGTYRNSDRDIAAKYDELAKSIK
jgi:tetratricopeptide (TPR) repeat protein